MRYLFVGMCKFLMALLMNFPAMGIAKESDQVLRVGFGAAKEKPEFEYVFASGGGGKVSFKLVSGKKPVEEGVFDYPDGYAGFVGDLLSGFQESVLASPLNELDAFEPEEMRELELHYGTERILVSWHFVGPLESYFGFVKRSPKLQRAFAAAASGRPRKYRLWEK